MTREKELNELIKKLETHGIKSHQVEIIKKEYKGYIVKFLNYELKKKFETIFKT